MHLCRPSNEAVLSELAALSEVELSIETMSETLDLIKHLVHHSMNAEEHAQILVPDSSRTLRPLRDVYFNDLFDRASLVDLPLDAFTAHAAVSEDLAGSLRMKRLGESELKFTDDDDDEDMGEALTSRICNVLRQYTIEQAINEFVANAADAGAKNIHFIVDESTPPGSAKLLSSKMASLHFGPALLVHNDAVFSETDWKGIRRTGTGGKAHRSDTIGQFGLGALCMFHFSEVSRIAAVAYLTVAHTCVPYFSDSFVHQMAMIVSGKYVMFLDPAKVHLPQSGRASLKRPLSWIRR